MRQCGEIGRRVGFKIRWRQLRVGSSPTAGISALHKGTFYKKQHDIILYENSF